VDQVIRDLRIILEKKNMKYQDLFKFIDKDQHGFITAKEFSQQIDKLISISSIIKDEFFAYMDKMRIGMVDLEQFLKVMRKSVVSKEIIVTPDNFEWETEMVVKIREWFA